MKNTDYGLIEYYKKAFVRSINAESTVADYLDDLKYKVVMLKKDLKHIRTLLSLISIFFLIVFPAIAFAVTNIIWLQVLSTALWIIAFYQSIALDDLLSELLSPTEAKISAYSSLIDENERENR